MEKIEAEEFEQYEKERVHNEELARKELDDILRGRESRGSGTPDERHDNRTHAAGIRRRPRSKDRADAEPMNVAKQLALLEVERDKITKEKLKLIEIQSLKRREEENENPKKYDRISMAEVLEIFHKQLEEERHETDMIRRKAAEQKEKADTFIKENWVPLKAAIRPGEADEEIWRQFVEPEVRERELNRRKRIESLKKKRADLEPFKSERKLQRKQELEVEHVKRKSSMRSDELSYAETKQATDSGYASLKSRNCGKPQETQSGIQEDLTKLRLSPAAEDVMDCDDAATVYSDASSVAVSAKEHYISELADALFREVLGDQLDSKILERVSVALPELLKAFALKIGYNAPSQMHRDIMLFVHKNRGDVAEYFRERCSREEAENLPSTQTTDPNRMTWSERVEFWHERLEYPLLPHQDSIVEEQTEGEAVQEEEVDHLALLYRDFIFKTPAFEWLVGILRRDVLLTPAEPNYMETIRKTIIESLPSSRRISKHKSAETFRVIFMTCWKPLTFISEQDYEDGPGEAIERAITLTGSVEDAQVLACGEYLCQTWPSTGKYIMQLIKDVVHSAPGALHTCVLPDDSRVIMSLQETLELVVEAFGTKDSVAEIGQQLAWLKTALSSSSQTVGVVACIPSISNVRVPNPQELRFVTSALGPQDLANAVPNPPGALYRLNFTIEEEEENLIPSNGQCWHNMFKNPVVVRGYPIPRRPNLNTGLEIPLNVMAGLARTQYIQTFHEKLFIKGFSTLLVPTKMDGGVLIWHLIYNQQGNRISYLENAVPHAEGLSVSEIETSRHVLGWCPKVEYYAGAADASYDIQHSGLSKPHGGYVLEGIYIHGRRIIKGGSPFSLGNKDTPFHISREDPVRRLQWLDQKFFVLWDEGDKRGWLINGTSVLLHLLRKSLEDNSTDRFCFEYCFKKEHMQEAPVTHKTFSAIRVLRNDANLKQEIYPRTVGYFRVENRLDELFDTLEKIIEHQISITRQDAACLNSKRQEYLEGWDFNDLATSQDPIHPRVARFQKASGGWVDFTRTIHAVALFGRGFGEIIQPESTTSLCSRWARLPKEEYYLAAAVDDLKEIMKKNGDQYTNPMRLTDDIFWQTPTFRKCKCRKKKRGGKHSDFVQTPLPARLCNILPNKDPIHLDDGGAVIFGQSKKLKGFFLENLGSLDGASPLPSEELETRSHDSGIGSSLGPSFTHEDYKVGVVCALPKELLAVRALFDSKHERLASLRGDINHYALGHIQPHNIVAACLPSGEYGTSAAAGVLSHMRRSFPMLEICLLVGIGGGVPSKKNDIRLGDVVVSHPTSDYPGVIQYDLGKTLNNNTFERTGFLQRPPRFIMTAISSLTSDPDIPLQPLEPYLKDIAKKRPEYNYPGHEQDPLLATNCIHRNHPKIHYGLIASGNQVMKNAKVRDQLGAEFNVLCFEMEAAGVMNAGDCLVIRGICDYSDSEKNDVWQEYAAATAAAYAKLLLSKMIIPGDAEVPLAGLERAGSRKRELSSERSNSALSKKLKSEMNA
ncbi:hypothetical protein TWF506_003099 [Arthrobotrys conoides]|uniref:Nucleoside phosphorylase domain-containing protein n=1 Tax=Arthrobotrys conoides TaxID=74498 RepID=A0AAN8NMS2_9PEZI